MTQIPIPKTAAELVRTHIGSAHPGLVLDKYVTSYASHGARANSSWQKDVQLPTIKEVVQRSAREPDKLGLQALLVRRRQMFKSLQATCFQAETTGPLTLHLARASVLENAGICLHPLYGFTYLPGTGLKGMAHAYATQVWIESQPDKQKAWDQIREVFGWAKAPLLKKIARDLAVSNPDGSQAGSIVFHDAWPVDWPRLTTDIVNNHHPEYYQAAGNGNANPPGDWENPNPVYFLAVPEGQKFEFTVAPRTGDHSSEDVNLARQWLLGALCHLGAGAKTNAGYGGFKPVEGERPKLESPARREFETTVELITPAFLAGADQEASDCNLRPATLRGLLRWWWRTMHAGFLDVDQMRELEKNIWGNSSVGGAVRTEVICDVDVNVAAYDKRSFASMNSQMKMSQYGIPDRPANKTTQGLWYSSFGMDESRRRRHFAAPGTKWRVRFVARDASTKMTAAAILHQVQAALWLLCQYGGVGSKGRNGFGSLQIVDVFDWDDAKCLAVATQARAAMSMATAFKQDRAKSPALHQRIDLTPIVFPWPDVWDVLDQLGFACQSFAAKYKHRREKKALGLPRRIGRPEQGDFRPTGPVQELGNKARHASPTHFHVARNGEGHFEVRALALPAAFLPDLQTSRDFLQEYLVNVSAELQRRSQLAPPPPRRRTQYRNSGQDRGVRGAQLPRAGAASGQPVIPKPGDRVTATLIEERTKKKGGWQAKHSGSNLSGPVVNTAEVPADKKAGDEMEFVVNSANDRMISFRVPGERDKKKPGGKKRPRDNRR